MENEIKISRNTIFQYFSSKDLIEIIKLEDEDIKKYMDKLSIEYQLKTIEVLLFGELGIFNIYDIEKITTKNVSKFISRSFKELFIYPTQKQSKY